MQVVILAGGLATRLRPVTAELPKSMVEVLGKPFLEYQIELLRRNDVSDIVLCVGHLARVIQEHFGDGSRLGIRIRYSDEGQRHLGTGGALKWAERLLADTFFVLFGDSYLMLDYRSIMRHFLSRDRLGLMVVYRNDGRHDRSDLIVEDGVVAVYDKNHPSPARVYINEGLSVLRREALAGAPRGQPLSLQELYRPLIAAKQLLALETQQRFYEIGSLHGLAEFERLAARRGLPA
ncbi:MAG: sugar phosphate nucleotidyltransferase [Candidatus Methylomirabilia bacterium]